MKLELVLDGKTVDSMDVEVLGDLSKMNAKLAIAARVRKAIEGPTALERYAMWLENKAALGDVTALRRAALRLVVWSYRQKPDRPHLTQMAVAARDRRVAVAARLAGEIARAQKFEDRSYDALEAAEEELLYLRRAAAKR